MHCVPEVRKSHIFKIFTKKIPMCKVRERFKLNNCTPVVIAKFAVGIKGNCCCTRVARSLQRKLFGTRQPQAINISLKRSCGNIKTSYF